MAANIIDTPATNNASYLTNGFDGLDDMSPEKSFFDPTHRKDLISQMRSVKGAGLNLKTPRVGSRDPLRLLPNGNQGKSEFTPMMQSVTKKNMARRLSSKKSAVPDTPAFLKDIGGATPALPRMAEVSQLQSEHTSSSAGHPNDFTPMPHNVSSSAHSTPLAQLPARTAGGVVNDGNMMTLREQENIIDKIEKENFGLKMKIHFLEEAISKRGGEFNQAALKENTELKVTRITMQKELHKFKKNIAQAERDAEIYRLQLDEYKERIRRKHVDESVRVEVEGLRSELNRKTVEIQEFRDKDSASQEVQSAEVEDLRGQLEDLQLESREKDRLIEQREDEIDALKMNSSKESNAAADLKADLEAARQQIEDLERDLEGSAQEAKDAKDDQQDAEMEKRKAEQDLDELRDEMANKSFTTKGLGRQLEEKVGKLEDELQDVQERYETLQSEVEQKVQNERKLTERLRQFEKEGATDLRHLQQKLEAVEQQRDSFERKLNNMSKQAESSQHEMQIRTEEKDLLQIRHDALTAESAQLQSDLAKSKASIQELQNALDDERHRAAQNDNSLRSQHKNEVDLLHEQVDELHREVNSRTSDQAAGQEEWEAQRRGLEAIAQRAQEQAAGLQRTVDKLQDAQGTLSGKEMKLQEAFASEQERHKQEEAVLVRQIEELNQDLAEKRNASETRRDELSNAKEERRISLREQAGLKEKVSELEEEIEVLQADIEQEHELAEQLRKKSAEAADVHVQKITKEKHGLESRLEDAQKALKLVEAQRDELEVKLEKNRTSRENTFDIDQEKRELVRAKQKADKDLDKLRLERDRLQEANIALEEEINTEIDRANAEELRLTNELDALRTKQLTVSDVRDRELTSSKSKVARLESRIKELEDMLDNQSKEGKSPTAGLSELRHDLVHAREKETVAIKRESELKSTNRNLKMQINDLERELHDARVAQLKSPSVSPPPSNSKELASLRQELVDSRAELRKLQKQNKDLERTAKSKTEDATVQDQLQSSIAEVEALNEKVSKQERALSALRTELSLVRATGEFQRSQSTERSGKKSEQHITGPELQDQTQDLSLQLIHRDNSIREMQKHLKRLRHERSIANENADAVEVELETLQTRYENVLEKLMSGKNNKADIQVKEMKGLVKEVMWLKAKCRREERLRKDLAWGKRVLEQEGAMRVQCNQVDLRILKDMGVSVDRERFEKPLRTVQKFRAGVAVVVAMVRMGRMAEQWRGVRGLESELERVSKIKEGRERLVRDR